MTLSARARSGTHIITLAVMIILLAVPSLGTTDRVVYLLAVAMVYATAAVGMDVIAGYGGLLAIAAFAFLSIGSYIVAILVVNWNVPIWWTLPAAAGGTALIAFILGSAMIRLKELGIALGTFFLSFVVAVLLAGSLVSGLIKDQVGVLIPPAELGGWTLAFGEGLYYLAWATLFVVAAVSLRYVNSRAGKALRAVKRSGVVAESLGINVVQARLAAFVWMAAACGTAGFVFAQALGVLSQEAFPALTSVLILAMVVVGGMGSIAGPIIGAVFLQMVAESARGAENLRELVAAVVLIVFLVVLPEGLYSLAERGLAGVRSMISRGRPATAEAPSPSSEEAVVPLDLPERTEPADLSPARAMAGQAGDGPSNPSPARSSYDQPVGPATGPRVVTTAVPSGEPRLRVTGVGVRYGGVTALSDVSFDVQPGEIFAIIGPNGAGKTTLINCISGVQTHTGDVALNGERLSGRRPNSIRRLGVTRTFQNQSLVGDLSALDNVALGSFGDEPTRPLLDVLPTPRALRRERQAQRSAHAVLDLVDFPVARRQVLAADLSLAEQKVVDIARAIAARPDLLLLDEPTAGLAEHEMTMVQEALLKVRRESDPTIVVIAHHIGFVRAIADRALVLDFGKIIAEGTPDEVIARQDVQTAYLGEDHV